MTVTTIETNKQLTGSVILVGTIFTAFLILANLTAFKIASIGSFVFPAGLIFFPFTYIFDDILTEVYGFQISRRIIWTALLANIIIIFGTTITTYLTPAPFWHDQTAFALVYQAIPRVFIASMCGYLCGEFTNSIILAKLKILTHGRHLWLRIIASTMVGVAVDTVIFTHIAFAMTIPYSAIWKIILSMYAFKVSYEIIAIPLTYKIANYLKQKDQIDHFDHDTNFNPFSVKI